MTALTFLFGAVTFYTLAPVPPALRPDPMARGYMGITVANGTLAVERVEPGLPAEAAGLRRGDILIRVGTLQPETFDQVIAHITSFRPGAVVEIEVQRGAARKTFKVKLACRPPELDIQNRVPVPIEIDD
ncbi:PDZ domain-containing protein [Gemmata sp. JC717]|uniref:PDZ domain-containing protein n=1 Tax=Gemmata algarum TaxID=2975278 RepID=A0ABU5F6X2_9BACT|nr:PDZ domain-containing protein [Gemmata algarum]MDY3556571.1 PDZ domain-containing protein [Gemmata algarum]MDY3563060.1 PDZ domain-containing protein [Gemmata algarum]